MNNKKDIVGLVNETSTKHNITFWVWLQATWSESTDVDVLAHGQRRWLVWEPRHAFESMPEPGSGAWDSFEVLRLLFDQVGCDVMV